MKYLNPLLFVALSGVLATTPVISSAQAAAPKDDADAFGMLDAISDVELSADGKKLVYVGSGGGASTLAVVINLETGAVTQATRGDGKPINIGYCNWSAADRIVCSLHGLENYRGTLFRMRRTVAMDIDGKNQIFLGQKDSLEQERKRFSDGWVLDWLNGVDGKVLMVRSYVREATTGRMTARADNGLGVDLIDTRTGAATQVERPGETTRDYTSDGLGHVRIVSSEAVSGSGYVSGMTTHAFRLPDSAEMRQLGTYTQDRAGGGRGKGIWPLAVDPRDNAAYVIDALGERRALFKITLDASMKRELVFDSKEVDVDGAVTIGRSGRVIGATYTTDRTYVHYFDPDYQKIHEMLTRAIPKTPLIFFVSASADEQLLVVHASADNDPGSWYLYDRAKKSLGVISAARPALKGKTLSTVKPMTYAAADGTQIPAYLTLPPGVTEAKNLPAIVMPHGGPGARDSWGFDWLAQFFAQRGYAVIQPNFRGSEGYGEAWFENNGFRDWKIAIGDVCDAGRWMVKQGLADPSKLAIVGWSYGGYAALQSNVLDPDLFKAVVAIAPVADLELLKSQHMLMHANAAVVSDWIGSGPHIKEGSPAQNSGAFKAPVLMFQGDIDVNVDIAQPRLMDKELRKAGKSSELIVYKDLEHNLADSSVRADMLRKSDAFLRKNLKL